MRSNRAGAVRIEDTNTHAVLLHPLLSQTTGRVHELSRHVSACGWE